MLALRAELWKEGTRKLQSVIFLNSRDGVRRKGGTAWVKFQVSKELIHKQ